MRRLLGDNDVLAYLVMMTARLIELRRVLRPTGSLYLHCDPTASHYLKVILDAIFGVENFRNEIVWQRSTGKSLSTVRLPNNHDVLLAYSATEAPQWSLDAAFLPYDEQQLDERTASKYRHRDASGRLYRLDSLINPNPDLSRVKKLAGFRPRETWVSRGRRGRREPRLAGSRTEPRVVGPG